MIWLHISCLLPGLRILIQTSISYLIHVCCLQRALLQPYGTYYQHLQTLAGGNCSKESADKHQKSCNAVLRFHDNPLDSSESSISSIIDTKYKSGIWKPNTCKVYLNALLKFINYMSSSTTHSKMYNLQSLSSVATTMQQLRNSLGQIAKSQRKAHMKRLSVAESSTRLTPEDFKGYSMSNRLTETMKMMADGKARPTKNNHTRVRNCLLLKIITANPHRTGALMNVTLTEMFEGKSQKNGHHVLLVAKHKTQSTYGPADIIVDQETYKLLEVYRDKYRPDSDAQELFVSWSGKALDASSIINGLSSELLHAGIENKWA